MKNIIADYISMTKPRLAMLNIIAVCSGVLVTRESFSEQSFFSVLYVSLLIAGAGVLNCVMEKEGDKHMARTKSRPLPSGRISIPAAFVFGMSFISIGLCGLYFKVNILTFWLGVTSVISYVLIYTPMKRMTHLAVYAGAVPGALPPVLGYVSVANELDLISVVLFSTLFFWQISHFLAISIYQAKDYSKGKILVYPNIRGLKHTRFVMVLFALLTGFTGVMPYFLGVSNITFLVLGSILGVAFIYINSKNINHILDNETEVNKWARQCFFASIIYLPLLFGFMIIF